MNPEHEPPLEELFRTPPALSDAGQFCTGTATAVDRYQRRHRLARLGVEIAVLVAAWIVSEPLHALATEMMPWIMTSLVDTGDGVLSQLLAPLNSVAGMIALLFLLGGAFYRRLFRA